MVGESLDWHIDVLGCGRIRWDNKRGLDLPNLPSMPSTLDSSQFPPQEATVKRPSFFPVLHPAASLAAGWLYFQKLEAVHSGWIRAHSWVGSSSPRPRGLSPGPLPYHAILDTSPFLCLLLRSREGTASFLADFHKCHLNLWEKKSIIQLSTWISYPNLKCQDV